MGPRRSLEDYTEADFTALTVPGSHILSGISSVGVRPIATTNHSKTFRLWVEYLKKKRDGKDVFAKQYFTPTAGSQSYRDKKNPDMLSSREARATRRLWNLWPGSDGLVTTTYGLVQEEPMLLQRFIEGECEKDRLVRARKTGIGKKEILEDTVRCLARFDGMLAPYSRHFEGNPFGFTLSEVRDAREAKVGALYNHLLGVVGYDLKRKGVVDEDITDEQLAEVIRDSILKKGTLYERVAEVVDSEGGFCSDELTLQQGDFRVHHVINDVASGTKKVVDHEEFGAKPRMYDLVTLTSAEGGIAMPEVEDLPGIVAVIRAYEDEGLLHDTDKQRRKALRRLDETDYQELVAGVDPRRSVLDLARYFSMAITEHLHLDATNKNGTEEARHYHIDSIPGYTEEEMFRRRLATVGDLFRAVGNNQLLWGFAEQGQRTGIQEHFHTYRVLLDELGVDIYTPVSGFGPREKGAHPVTKEGSVNKAS